MCKEKISRNLVLKSQYIPYLTVSVVGYHRVLDRWAMCSFIPKNENLADNPTAHLTLNKKKVFDEEFLNIML